MAGSGNGASKLNAHGLRNSPCAGRVFGLRTVLDDRYDVHLKKKAGAIFTASALAGLFAASAPAYADDDRPTRGIRITNHIGIPLQVVWSDGGDAMWAKGHGPDDTPALNPGQTTNWEALLYGQADGTVALEDVTGTIHVQIRIVVGMINQSIYCAGSFQPRGENFMCKGEGYSTNGTLELIKG